MVKRKAKEENKLKLKESIARTRKLVCTLRLLMKI